MRVQHSICTKYGEEIRLLSASFSHKQTFFQMCCSRFFGGTAHLKKTPLCSSFFSVSQCLSGEFSLKHRSNIWILALCLVCLAGCDAVKPATPKKTFLVMGTVASVSLPADAAGRLDTVTDLVTNTMFALERKLSVYVPESEISRLNDMAGQSPVTISDDTLNLLEISKYYSELSKGAFDVTVGPVLRAWGLNHGTLPKRRLTKKQLAPLLENVGSHHIVLSGNTAFLDTHGVQVNLGGLAKGYAVDACCHQLLGQGVSNILINLGGNIRCLGYSHDKHPWRIGVRNPFYPKQILGTLQLSNGQSVATSGNYERFVTINHRRYAHIVDPFTGYPIEGMAAVTVISHSAVEADALSTALFVQGMKQGLSTLRKTALCDALFVPDKQPVEIWITEGLSGRFQPDASVSNRVFLLETSPPKQEEALPL